MIFNKQFSKLHVDIHTITNIAEDSGPYSGHIVTTDKLANLALRGAGDPSRPGVGGAAGVAAVGSRAGGSAASCTTNSGAFCSAMSQPYASAQQFSGPCLLRLVQCGAAPVDFAALASRERRLRGNHRTAH